MEITAQYSEALLKRVTRRYCLKLLGWRGPAIIAFAGCVVILNWRLNLGVWPWLIDAVVAAGALFIGIVIRVYFSFLKRSLSAFRRLDSPVVVFTLSDDGIAWKHSLGSTDMRWCGVVKVMRFPEAWLLFHAEHNYFTLPSANLTDEARALILAKVRENGGRVL